MAETKRPTLSLPRKPVAESTSSEGRTRLPLRGGNKARAPKPVGARPARPSSGGSGKSPRGTEETPRRSAGDQPPRDRGDGRPSRPHGDEGRPSGERQKTFGERPGSGFGKQNAPSRGDQRGSQQGGSPGKRPRPDKGNDRADGRPLRASGDERRSFGGTKPDVRGDRPRRYQGDQPLRTPREERGFDERRNFNEGPRRKDGEARPVVRERPRRSLSEEKLRPRRDEGNMGERRSYSERRQDTATTPEAPRGTAFSRKRVSDGAAPPRPRVERPASTPRLAPAQARADPEGSVRLSKRMAELGLCSRREGDEYIERGWVRVDGVVVNELGSKVLPSQQIELSQMAEAVQERRITVLLNKPIGYVSGQAEDGYEPAAVLITPENHWEEDSTRRRYESRIIRKLAPAGRLDIDSTGLLVLTQDGRIAKHLVGASGSVEKEYLVRVEGELSTEGLKLLNHGLVLDGVELRPARVSWQNEDQLRFALREGRKRQIRRMCELVGLRVVGLKRIRIGRVKLGRLPLGQWRYLAEGEEF